MSNAPRKGTFFRPVRREESQSSNEPQNPRSRKQRVPSDESSSRGSPAKRTKASGQNTSTPTKKQSSSTRTKTTRQRRSFASVRSSAPSATAPEEESEDDDDYEVIEPPPRGQDTSTATRKESSSTPLVSRDPAKTARQYRSFSPSKSSTPSKILPKDEFDDDDYELIEPPPIAPRSRTHTPSQKVVPAADKRKKASPQRKKAIPSTRGKGQESSQKTGRSTNLPKESRRHPAAVRKGRVEDSETKEEKEEDEAKAELPAKKVNPPARKKRSPQKPVASVSPRRSDEASKTSTEELQQQENTARRINATKADRTSTKEKSRRKSTPRKLIKVKKVVREILKYQSGSQLLIPRLPFSRLVREILHAVDESTSMRMTKEALQALHEAAEIHLVSILEGSYEMALHARRKTLLQRDLVFFINMARKHFGCDY